MKNTKIVATIGPASESEETLRLLVEAGMNVVRLNFSHGEHEWHRQVISLVRKISEEISKPIAVLADMQGPRIRIGNDSEIEVREGSSVRISDISYSDGLSETDIPTIILDIAKISDALEAGHQLLVEDGMIRFSVTGRAEGAAMAIALTDGVVKPRKGVNLPDSRLKLPILSEKDRRDVEFVLAEGVDYIGLSFVGSAEDIESARETMKGLLPKDGHLPEIISKIERREAVRNLDGILDATDAVMVARGDLGIEMPESEVALLQKDIIRRSLMAVKPVIVATQMMKSMTGMPTPTRAEVSDVTNAVVDHTDAVMLSEESAMGKYPVETVAMMREIIEKTEESPFDDVYAALDFNIRSESATIIRSAYELSRSFGARSMLLYSQTGHAAKLASHFRPETGVLVATDDRFTYDRLALVWGVRPYLFQKSRKHEALIDRLVDRAKEDGFLAKGDRVVVFLGKSAEVRDNMRLVGIREIR
jgi:pyruvate kinase